MASRKEGFFEPDYPVEKSTKNTDIETSWIAVLKEFGEGFRPIAERFGERNVRFTPENCWLFVDTLDMVDETCHDILNANYNSRLFGCTTQDEWFGDLDLPYEKPISETYIADNWAPDFVRNVEWHELSHQAIVSVRQMLEKDHQRRKANGQIRLKDAHFQEIKNDIDMVNMYMDLWENGKLNPITGEVEMKGRFDVYPKLRLIIDKYFDCLNGD